MKKLFSLIVISLTMQLISCKKDPADSLTGNWELRHVNGSQMANASPDYAPGNGNMVRFTGTEFEKYWGGKLIQSSPYTVLKEEKVINNDKVSFCFVNSKNSKIYFNINKNELTLYTGEIAADGVEEIYIRQ